MYNNHDTHATQSYARRIKAQRKPAHIGHVIIKAAAVSLILAAIIGAL